MIVNGVDVSALEIDRPLDIPPVVPGRVLQVDGDQLCYLAGCYDDEPFAIAKRNFSSVLESWMMMAGAEKSIIHLTGDNKGGRFDIATLKEYQANRNGKARPKHLSALRAYVQESYDNVIYHEDQEADDGMAQCNYNAYWHGVAELSIICSSDKDLRMCSGWHLDQSTGECIYVDGYGAITLEDGKPKKIKGYGTSFFWAQLLMGDAADNIPGLPALGPPTIVRHKAFHTQALIKLLDKCEFGKTTEIQDAAAEKIDNMKHKLCGTVAAYNILENCTTDLEALQTVVQCYRDHYGLDTFEYTHWNGETVVGTAGSMLVEQANLLWMRRTLDDTPEKFFSSIIDGGRWYE